MKTLLVQIIFVPVLVLCLMRPRAHAQNPSIDWFQVASGGGASTGGAYSLDGAIGPAGNGVAMTGGNYSATGGFWTLAIQTSTSPKLFIMYSGTNVIVSWQVQSGWGLQENSNLSEPMGWTNSSGLVTVNGVSYHSVNNSSINLFFRLKHN